MYWIESKSVRLFYISVLNKHENNNFNAISMVLIHDETFIGRLGLIFLRI